MKKQNKAIICAYYVYPFFIEYCLKFARKTIELLKVAVGTIFQTINYTHTSKSLTGHQKPLFKQNLNWNNWLREYSKSRWWWTLRFPLKFLFSTLHSSNLLTFVMHFGWYPLPWLTVTLTFHPGWSRSQHIKVQRIYQLEGQQVDEKCHIDFFLKTI